MSRCVDARRQADYSDVWTVFDINAMFMKAILAPVGLSSLLQ
jgi:hypothetical protein